MAETLCGRFVHYIPRCEPGTNIVSERDATELLVSYTRNRKDCYGGTIVFS